MKQVTNFLGILSVSEIFSIPQEEKDIISISVIDRDFKEKIIEFNAYRNSSLESLVIDTAYY